MGTGYTTDNIIETSVLSEEQRAAFDKEFAETCGTQATYEEIITELMEKKGFDAADAAELTGLNQTLFKNLNKPGGSILKRFVISIAVGFRLDVHLTEYILEACGMRFREASKLDKAYIYILENCKGKGIAYCNGVLRDLGVEEKDMLGELERGSYKKKPKAD